MTDRIVRPTLDGLMDGRMDSNRLMMIGLLALPATAALVVACLGPRRRTAIRWICLGVTLLDALLAFALTFEFKFLTNTRMVTPAVGGGMDREDRGEFVQG